MNDGTTPRWGGQTAAAIVNFGRGQTPRALIQALAEVKEAVLRALQETEEPWKPTVYRAVLEALKEIREGLYDGEFPLDLAQGGAGTSLHMNICEVLASLVEEKAGPSTSFHALDDGARSQSTNDVVSTAVIVVVQRLIRRIETSVIALQEALVEREAAWRGTLVTGRTEWQAALPMDLSLVAGAWAGSAERDRWRLGKLKERTRTVPLGGTAVGTGSGARGAYLFAVERQLRSITGLPLQRSQNLSDAVAQRDDLAEVAQVFKVAAANLVKLCRDLFFYTSSSVGELVLPQLQWGSTAMPLKNNPVLVEFASGLAIRCQCFCDAVFRYTEEGFLQLNAYGPFMLSALLSASEDLGTALDTLSTGLLPRLGVDPIRSFRNLAQSSAPLNALRPELPYDFLKTLAEGNSGSAVPMEETKKQEAGKEDTLTMEEEILVRRLSEITGLEGAVIRRRLGLRPLAVEAISKITEAFSKARDF